MASHSSGQRYAFNCYIGRKLSNSQRDISGKHAEEATNLLSADKAWNRTAVSSPANDYQPELSTKSKGLTP